MRSRTVRLGFETLVAVVLTLGVTSVTGCAADSTDESTSSDSAVVIERQRLDDLVAQSNVASQKSEDLKKVSIGFVGVRDPVAILPVFATANDLSSALDPVLLKLEQRLSETPSEDLRRQGYADVAEAEYRAVIDVVRGIRTSLSSELPAAAAMILGAPQGTLTDAQKTQLRTAISAYSDIVFAISGRLSGVSAQLKTWLTKATNVAAPTSSTVEKRFDVAVIGECRARSRPEQSWDAMCASTKNAYVRGFPDTVDYFTCGTVADTGNYCSSSTGVVTYRIPVTSEAEIEVVPQSVRGRTTDNSIGAAASWTAACENLLENAQSFTVPNRKVVGGACGVPRDVGDANYYRFSFESTATLLIVRR